MAENLDNLPQVEEGSEPPPPPPRGPSDYPCEQCGANLKYTPGTRELQCGYCNHVTLIPQSPEEVVELNFEEYLRQQEPAELMQSLMVRCNGCGATTTMPERVTAGSCSFCGQPLVATAQATRLIKPNAVLPFALKREQARQAFEKWVHNLWWAPSQLKQRALADDRFSGVYLPYWTFDSRTTTAYQGERGVDYWATQMVMVNINGRLQPRTRRVRKTRWYSASGTVVNRFNDLLVLACLTLPEKFTRELEPWDLKNLMPYDDAYLSGFRAHAYQVDLPAGFHQAVLLMDPRIEQTIRADIGGDHQRIHLKRSRHDQVTFKHILLPVWASAYQYQGKTYRFVVNARTGEVQGERPYSYWKIGLAVCAAAIGLFILVVGLMVLSRHWEFHG